MIMYTSGTVGRALCSTQRRSRQRKRGEKFLSAGERQSEHILGHNKASAGRDSSNGQEQGEGIRGC